MAVNAVLADPKLAARLVQLGGVPMPMTPAQFGKLIADETEKWAKVVRSRARSRTDLRKTARLCPHKRSCSLPPVARLM
jgi:hypothetical protein